MCMGGYQAAQHLSGSMLICIGCSLAHCHAVPASRECRDRGHAALPLATWRKRYDFEGPRYVEHVK